MIHPDFEEYASNHTSEELDVLKKLSRETNLKVMQPRMLSGHLQGKFLEIISCMLKPERILEIGTFTAYSAIALAQGLHENGVLHTIDIDQELELIVSNYIKEAGLEKKIKFFLGDAKDIIPKLDFTYDLVFIDADKENYINYYNMVIPKVRKGGIIIADNVLWSGKVLVKPQPNDKNTINLQAFNEYVTNDSRVENVLLPFRDGLMIVMKK